MDQKKKFPNFLFLPLFSLFKDGKDNFQTLHWEA